MYWFCLQHFVSFSYFCYKQLIIFLAVDAETPELNQYHARALLCVRKRLKNYEKHLLFQPNLSVTLFLYTGINHDLPGQHKAAGLYGYRKLILSYLFCRIWLCLYVGAEYSDGFNLPGQKTKMD